MKKEFLKHLDPSSVLLLEGKNKKEIFEEIVSHATTRCTLDEAQLRELIWKREKMMTTGVGKGLALPHIRVPGFPSPLVVLGVCKNEVTGYNSLDSLPIRLVVFLAADERDQEAYLRLLGSISSTFKTPGIMEKVLEKQGNASEIIRILEEA